MKRMLCLLTALLMLLLTACSSGAGQPTPPDPTATVSGSAIPTPTPEAPSEQPTAEPSAPPDGTVNPLTGLPMEESQAAKKPVAIMLNNIKAAMPQQGVSRADLIYEVPAEGGITRMLGVYQSISDLGLVGSVRSARRYYLELALGHDAIYVHAGGSPEFYEKSQEWGLSTVDGVNGYYAYASTGLFWRDRERIQGHYYAYEHSLLTSGEALTKVLTARNVLGDHQAGWVSPLTFAPDGTPANGQSARTVTVPFSGSKTTLFRYEEADGLYYAQQYGGPYIDGNDGSQVAVTNLLVLRTQCTVVDDAGRLSIDLSAGEGWFACGGRIVPIRWEKGDRNDPLRYYTADGLPLTLGQGKSYICIIPLSREISVE